MTAIHRYVAYSIPAAFALLAVWTVVALFRKRPPGGAFWNVLAVAQVVLIFQVVLGGVLFATGLRAPQWLHYFYGGVFPVVVLVIAHLFDRVVPGGVAIAAQFFRRPVEDVPWIVFGVAGLVNFGLTFRALQTGFWIG